MDDWLPAGIANWKRTPLRAEYRAGKGNHILRGQGVRKPSSGTTSNTENDPLSTRRCAVCTHFECHHDVGGCFRDPNGKRSQDPGILSRAALKATCAECWCPRFTADFSQAVIMILGSGNSRALKQGTETSIARSDPQNAQRLLDQLIMKTSPEARDLEWIKAAERGIAAIESRRLRSTGTKKPGRARTRPPEFVNVAANLWIQAIQQSDQTKVTAEQMKLIALSLDEQGYVPPAKYLERKAANELREFNSKNSRSEVGPIQTWSRLVAVGDKDHIQGMRRLLSRCAETLPR
jgi:hypothetical protein